MRQIDVRSFIRIFRQLQQLFLTALRPVLACMSLTLAVAIAAICIPKYQAPAVGPTTKSAGESPSVPAPTNNPAINTPEPQAPLAENVYPQAPSNPSSTAARSMPVITPPALRIEQFESPSISQPADDYVPSDATPGPQPDTGTPNSPYTGPTPETPVQQ